MGHAFHIRSASFVKGATGLKGMPTDGRPEIAFVGRSNVGKSSLLNMLLGRKGLARTSATPGKTREVNFFLVNDAFYFVDLPGFGYARTSRSERARWHELIGRYLVERPELRIVFQLIDARHAPTDLDMEAAGLIGSSGAFHVALLTKGDKLSGNKRGASVKRALGMLESIHLEIPVVLTSAETGRGRDEVYTWIRTLMA